MVWKEGAVIAESGYGKGGVQTEGDGASGCGRIRARLGENNTVAPMPSQPQPSFLSPLL